MEALTIKNSEGSLQITFDKQFFDEEFLRETVEQMRMEYLARKADFDESIEEVGNDIKRTWWQRNKTRYIQE